MLDEYALVPDIFDPAAYTNSAYPDMCLPHLKEPLFQEALVRNLCNGGWSQFCSENAGNLHRLTKEILRKLVDHNRLCPFPAQGDGMPVQAADWCKEAMIGHAIRPLNGIIAAHATKQQFTEPEVACIEKLTGANWWQNRSPSNTVDRKTQSYLNLLGPVLRQANSLMFIDPNLDPSQGNYRDFYRILEPLASRSPPPSIELHRSFCRGDGARRNFPTELEWRGAFNSLDAHLKHFRLSADVYLWEDFHDRYLVADIVGITIGAGFDVTGINDDMTTWSRLGWSDKDKIQRLYDIATRSGACRIRFKIGA